MSTTIWEFRYEEEEDSPLVTVSVCDYGTVHLHMEYSEPLNGDHVMSISMPSPVAEVVALEILRRAHSLDDEAISALEDEIRRWKKLAGYRTRLDELEELNAQFSAEQVPDPSEPEEQPGPTQSGAT